MAQSETDCLPDRTTIQTWYGAYVGRVGYKFWRDLLWLLAADCVPFAGLALLVAITADPASGANRDTFILVAIVASLAGLILLASGSVLHLRFRDRREDVEAFDRISLLHAAERTPEQILFVDRYVKAVKRRLSAERLVYSSVAGSLIVGLVIGLWFVVIGGMLHTDLIPQCVNFPNPGRVPRTQAMNDLCMLASYWYSGAAAFMVFGAVMIILWKHMRDRVNEMIERLLELHLRQEFLSTTLRDPMQRNAYKLLKLNEHELGRYYRLNLRQNSTVFYVGFGTMMLGFVIIGVTLYIIATSQGDKEMISAIFGGIGAVLTNFIAAIYLHLHGKTSDAMVQFHRRLADSNDLFLAHVLASLIDDEAKRYNALSELSRGIGSRNMGLSSGKL